VSGAGPYRVIRADLPWVNPTYLLLD
jgi:hypothetical protein